MVTPAPIAPYAHVVLFTSAVWTLPVATVAVVSRPHGAMNQLPPPESRKLHLKSAAAAASYSKNISTIYVDDAATDSVKNDDDANVVVLLTFSVPDWYTSRRMLNAALSSADVAD
jgi:hypothetical protein